MKYLSILFSWVIVLSCGANQNSTINKQEETLTDNCPIDGTCTINLSLNTSLDVKYDNLNALYPELIKGETLVLTYEYKRDEIPDTADSNYSELLYMELNPSALEINKNGAALKDVKLLFARLCYCKGQTGYYEINDGHLQIIKINDDTFRLNLEFNTDEVPQILNKISRTFTIPSS